MTEDTLQEFHAICARYAHPSYPMTANIAADCGLELIEEVRRLHAIIREQERALYPLLEERALYPLLEVR